MMETNDFDITGLLSSKPFEELTEAEKNFVIRELGNESAYREMYEVVKGTTEIESPKLSLNQRDRTFAAFDDVHNKNTSKKRNLFWLKPFVIGLAAASILAFILIIGINNTNEDERIAEIKPLIKKELKDSTSIKPLNNIEENELESPDTQITIKNKSENTRENFSEDPLLENKDFTLEATQSSLDDKSIIAEAVINEPELEIAEGIDIEDKYRNAHSTVESDDAVQGNEQYADDINSSKTSSNDEIMVASEVSFRKRANKSMSIQTESMGETNISKQSIFKVDLSLGIHYTAY